MAKDIAYILIDNIETFNVHRNKLLELLKASQADEAILGFDETFNDTDSSLYLDDLANEITSKTLQILIGNKQESLIVCCFLKKSHQKTTRHICDLQKGMIHPSLRRSGLLQQTLAEIAQACIAQNIDLLTLDVRGGSKAHHIWQRCGFETYGVLSDYSRYGHQSYDGYFMHQKTIDLWNRFKHFSQKGMEQCQ
ncbi:hypothetical protein [Photobacterium rosenbergii]|uniref:N-acetyltransferase domain-containing protein n=1 Tax=Photobacterium rosenbergii TaxID=294936 RepID=A0ABU3ZHT5_9GAMM|nr:hypothetical protein [Photobacterium rosenbergii]MDV5169700.1 hypothetical protein [Photobacterium rosenbergii]